MAQNNQSRMDVLIGPVSLFVIHTCEKVLPDKKHFAAQTLRAKNRNDKRLVLRDLCKKYALVTHNSKKEELIKKLMEYYATHPGNFEEDMAGKFENSLWDKAHAVSRFEKEAGEAWKKDHGYPVPPRHTGVFRPELLELYSLVKTLYMAPTSDTFVFFSILHNRNTLVTEASSCNTTVSFIENAKTTSKANQNRRSANCLLRTRFLKECRRSANRDELDNHQSGANIPLVDDITSAFIDDDLDVGKFFVEHERFIKDDDYINVSNCVFPWATSVNIKSWIQEVCGSFQKFRANYDRSGQHNFSFDIDNQWCDDFCDNFCPGEGIQQAVCFVFAASVIVGNESLEFFQRYPPIQHCYD
jgi:hypothetical protein